jgi:hypothetical protein
MAPAPDTIIRQRCWAEGEAARRRIGALQVRCLGALTPSAPTVKWLTGEDVGTICCVVPA